MGCTSSVPQGHANEPQLLDIASSTVFKAPAALPQDCLGKVLGEGTYGTIYAVAWSQGLFESSPFAQKPLAAKVIRFHCGVYNKETPKLRYEKALREADVWELLCSKPCEFLVSLVETFLDEQSVVFVMERCPTTLVQHIFQCPRFDEAVVAGLVTQMLHGLHHIHSCDVIHRNVKPGSFMMGRNATLKISDFGLAVTADDIWAKGNEPHSPRNPSAAPAVAGSAPFMSPEILSRIVYSTATDIWSLGCVAYTILMGQFPYMPKKLSGSTMRAAVLDGFPEPSFEPGPDTMFPNVPKGGYSGPSNDAVAFIVITLSRDAAARPTALEALEHPYLSRKLNVEESMQLPCLHNMVKRAKHCGAFHRSSEA